MYKDSGSNWEEEDDEEGGGGGLDWLGGGRRGVEEVGLGGVGEGGGEED